MTDLIERTGDKMNDWVIVNPQTGAIEYASSRAEARTIGSKWVDNGAYEAWIYQYDSYLGGTQ